MIKLVNVGKKYISKTSETVALKNISLELNDIGFVSIVGKSGSGKSTLLNVIGGLDTFTDGDILVNGKSLTNICNHDLDIYRNNEVGFIFQEYNVIDNLTVNENILLATDLQNREIDNKTLDDVLGVVELTGLGNKFAKELSGGQKQRVAIGRALIKQPHIILADEPSGSLDSITGNKIFELLKKISLENLVVVVTHDEEMAKKYSDRIIKIVDGSVVEDKCLNDICKNAAIQKSNVDQKKTTSLSFKNLLRLGLYSLKERPFKLLVTIILIAVSLGLFGISSSFMLFDSNHAINNALSAAHIDSVMVMKRIDYRELTYNVTDKGQINQCLDENNGTSFISMNKNDLDYLNNGNLDFSGIFNFNTSYIDNFSNIRFKFDCSSNANVSKFYSEFDNGLYGFSDCGKNYAEHNFQLISGNFPESINEIAISDVYCDYLHSICPNDDINYHSIIGKHYTISSVGLSETRHFNVVISGVYKTNNISKEYFALKERYKSNNDQLEIQWKSFVKSSFMNVGFVSDGFFDYYNGMYDFDAYYTNSKALESPLTITNNEDKYEVNRVLLMDDTNNLYKFHGLDGKEMKVMPLEKDEIYVSESYGKSLFLRKYYNLQKELHNYGIEGNLINTYNLKVFDKNINDYINSPQFINSYKEFLEILKEYSIGDSLNGLNDFYETIDDFVENSYSTLLRKYYIKDYVERIAENRSRIYEGIISPIDSSEKNQFDIDIDVILQNYNHEGNYYDVEDSVWNYVDSYLSNYYDLFYGYSLMLNKFERIVNTYNYSDTTSDILDDIDVQYGSISNFILRGKTGQHTQSDKKMVENVLKFENADISYFSYLYNCNRLSSNAEFKFNVKNNRNENKELLVKGFYKTKNNKNNDTIIISDEILDELNINFDADEQYVKRISEYDFNDDCKYYMAITNRKFNKKDIAKLNHFGDNCEYIVNDELSNSVRISTEPFVILIQCFTISSIVLAFFSGLLLSNFISNSIKIRSKEVGILRAMGISSKETFKMFSVETIIVCISSLIIGTILSILGILLFNNSLLSLINSSILSFGIINFLLLLAIAIIVSIVATFVPVYKLSAKSPISIIRNL